MTETPTPTVVEPTEVIKAVAFPVNKLVFLGLIGMVGALALLLFQAMHERDEYRRSLRQTQAGEDYLRHHPSANGKFDGPVTAPDAAEASDTGTASTEV